MISGWCNRKTDIDIEYDCSNSNQIVKVGACKTNKPKTKVHYINMITNNYDDKLSTLHEITEHACFTNGFFRKAKLKQRQTTAKMMPTAPRTI